MNGINSVRSTAYTANVQNTKAKEQKTEQTQKPANTDTFVKSEQNNEVTYEAPKRLTAEQVDALKANVQQSMQSLVKQMLGEQYKVAKKPDGGIDYNSLAKALGMGTTPETAAEAISEDGAWGVKAVADRIMNMAMSLSGGDSKMAGELREAVKKGFAQVGSLDKLPTVCQDTYKEIMNRFDHWEKNGSMDGYGEE